MTSMLNRALAMFGVLIAFGGMASAQQADGAASDQLRAVGFVQPNADDVRPFDLLGTADDRSINVFGAAQNRSTSNPNEHIYLYEPPLRFRVADDGMIYVRRNDYDPRKVIFYLENMNQTFAERIQALLDATEGKKVLAGNVRPLPYTFIVLNDDSEQWRSRYPEDNSSLPSPAQRWIPFEVDFARHEDGEERADEFANRLMTQEVEFDVNLVYGGREIVQNTVELTTKSLIETSFFADLTGDGEFTYVTRNQIRAALAMARTEIQATVYIEDPEAIVPSLEWPETTWEKITVRWDEFLSDYLARTSRFDVPGGDLMPDRFTRLEEHLKSEMEDETKDSIDMQASVEAEAGFLGIGGSAGGSGQMKKEEFDRRKRTNENGVEWEGEVFRPRTIDLFVMNANSLANEDRIGRYVITARLGTRRYEFNISSRQGVSVTDSDGVSINNFPSGAVVAFDREDGCPSGWSEYRDADGRFVVGTGRHSVHDAYGNELPELELGREGGERTHRLLVKEMPEHNHRHWFSDGTGEGPEADFRPDETFGRNRARRYDTTATGGNEPHNNMPPYIALRFCRLD